MQAEGAGQDSGGGIGTRTTASMIREEGTMPTREHRDAKTSGEVRGEKEEDSRSRNKAGWKRGTDEVRPAGVFNNVAEARSGNKAAVGRRTPRPGKGYCPGESDPKDGLSTRRGRINSMY